MKKLSAILFSIFVAILLLAACGTGADAPVVSEAAVEPSVVPSVEPTPIPTPEPTPEPTIDPNDKLELSKTELVFTEKSQMEEIYCGTVPMENISWTSDDESIAIFSQGTVIAINAGTTTVYAQYKDQLLSCKVDCQVDPDAPAHSLPYELIYAPRLAPPMVDLEEKSFFSDAAFIGDSVSYVLQRWHEKTACFGDAVFLVRSSMGLQNTIDGRFKLYYQGEELSVEDAVEKSGVNKVFVMLGMNDIALFGIDGTIERWEIFTDRIVEKSPDVDLYIQSCTAINHRGAYPGYDNDLFDQYNDALEQFCLEKGYTFVDIAPYFKDYTNGLPNKYSSDGFVHISYDGAAAWERVLKAYALSLEEGE